MKKLLLCSVFLVPFLSFGFTTNQVAGFVRQTVYPGYNLLAPALPCSNAPALTVFPCLQADDTLMFWVHGEYVPFTYNGTNWLDSIGRPSASPRLSSGIGVFYLNTGYTKTNVVTGFVVNNWQLTIPPGMWLVGSQLPQAGNVNNLTLPLQPGDELMSWQGAGFLDFLYIDSSTWLDGNTLNLINHPTFGYGEAFFYLNNQAQPETWSQTY